MITHRLYSHRTLVALLVVAVLAVGLMTTLVIRQRQDQTNAQVYLEAGGNVGSNPFVPLVVPPPESGGSPGGDAASFQQAGSTSNEMTCDPEKLITYLTSDQQAGEAWVRALNYDRTLNWSGGGRVAIQQIPAYIHELTPRLLSDDLRVTNYQFTNGVALPVQSVLQKGTAVLVDAKGTARVRCACGNPLTPMIELKVPPIYRGTPWPSFQAQRVVVTQRAPQCGDNEFYDGEHCRRNALCPLGEEHGVDGRCRVLAEPGLSDNGEPPDAQRWRDGPEHAIQARHPDELPPRDRPDYRDDRVQPARPIAPETPERPETPEHPDKPEHPDEPATPDKPERPARQGHPGYPDRPAGPERPESPAQPETPATPDKPERPEKPVTPDRPDKPGKPGIPRHSDDPTHPAEPKKPGKTAQPDTSRHAVKPGLPDDDQPDTSQTSHEPKQRARQSGQPDKPTQPDRPTQANKSTQADESSEPDKSQTPVKNKSGE